MEFTSFTVIGHLFGAALAGALIGLERTYHGRPAGFRTHVLVSTASSLLMLLSTAEAARLMGLPLEAVRVDPARMAQGIMTGIGFLGAGVIFKDGLSVRGLTTAASIWITSAIGILVGVGLHLTALMATALTLGTLSVFRWIERRLPTQSYAQHALRFDRASVMAEGDVRSLLASHGFVVSNMSYRVTDDGGSFEYRMVLRTSDPSN